LNVLHVVAALMCGLGESTLAEFATMTGNTCLPGCTQFYQIQRDVTPVLELLAQHSTHTALVHTIACTPNAKLEGIASEFDGRWGSRREASQAYQVLLSALPVPGYHVRPVIGAFTVRRTRFRHLRDGKTITLVAGNTSGSSQGMESIGLRGILDDVRPVLLKAETGLVVALDGDLSNSKVIREEYGDVVWETARDFGHYFKSVKKHLQGHTDVELKPFHSRILDWLETITYESSNRSWTMVEWKAALYNVTDHLSGLHTGCPPWSSCKNPVYDVAKNGPSLCGGAQHLVSLRERLVSILDGLVSLLGGQSLSTRLRTTHVEGFHSTCTKYAAKDTDFSTSGGARQAIGILINNQGVHATLKQVCDALNLGPLPDVIATALKAMDAKRLLRSQTKAVLYVANSAARRQTAQHKQQQRRETAWALLPTVMDYTTCVNLVERDMLAASEKLTPWLVATVPPMCTVCHVLPVVEIDLCLICELHRLCMGNHPVDLSSPPHTTLQKPTRLRAALVVPHAQNVAVSVQDMDERSLKRAAALQQGWHAAIQNIKYPVKQRSVDWHARRNMSVTGTNLHALMLDGSGMWTVLSTLLGLRDRPFIDTFAMARGRDQEPIELERYAKEHDVTLDVDGILLDVIRPYLMSSPDALVTVAGQFSRVLEVKSSTYTKVKPAWITQLRLNMLLAHCIHGTIIHHQPGLDAPSLYSYTTDAQWQVVALATIDAIARDYLTWFWKTEVDWVEGTRTTRRLQIELMKSLAQRTQYIRCG